jgi:hypothetical protein
VNTVRWVLADALQDIDEVVVGIDVMQSAGDDQALQDADLPGAEFGPAEHPVAATHRDDAQGPFEMIRIDRYVRVGEKDFQSEAAVAGIGQRLGQRVAGQQTLGGEAFVDPGEEALDDRLGMGQSVIFLLLAAEPGAPDVFLDRVQLADQRQRFGRRFRFGRLRLEEAATGMRPALGMDDPRLRRVAGIGG